MIGDVHGHIEIYNEIIKDCDYSIQLGDFGFKNEIKQLKYVNSQKHKIVAGNHDDYDHLSDHYMGDFGVHSFGDFEFFFIRGAYSIDQKRRIVSGSYWTNEELDYHQVNKMITEYEKINPQIVISHDCPLEIISFVGSHHYQLSWTNKFLSHIFNLNNPAVWFFGHHHMNKIIHFRNTYFIYLGELQFVDWNSGDSIGKNVDRIKNDSFFAFS